MAEGAGGSTFSEASDGQDDGQDDLSKYASTIASGALLGQNMQQAEREGDSEAIMAVRCIAMVAFFFGASSNRVKDSSTLMDIIVDFIGKSHWCYRL